MKLIKARKLRKNQKVSINGHWLEIVRIEETFHPTPKLMLRFLNGKSIIADKDEEFYVLIDE